MRWMPIKDAPTDGTIFLAFGSDAAARRRRGVVLRKPQVVTPHEWEQCVKGKWYPAMVTPRFWTSATDADLRDVGLID